MRCLGRALIPFPVLRQDWVVEGLPQGKVSLDFPETGVTLPQQMGDIKQSSGFSDQFTVNRIGDNQFYIKT